MVRGGGGGGIATARVKSKGPTGARAAAAGWAQPRAVPAAARPGGNRAAAAQKAAHRAAQNAAQRMHPHMMSAPQRAGGGHMSAVVPTHRLVSGCGFEGGGGGKWRWWWCLVDVSTINSLQVLFAMLPGVGDQCVMLGCLWVMGLLACASVVLLPCQSTGAVSSGSCGWFAQGGKGQRFRPSGALGCLSATMSHCV